MPMFHLRFLLMTPLSKPRERPFSMQPHSPLPLDALLAGARSQPEWVIPEILPVGVMLLLGHYKVGKSVLALGLALAVSEGKPFLDVFSVEQGDVLYLSLEDSQKTFYERARRFRHNGKVSSEEHGRPIYSCEWAGQWNALHTTGLADIEEWLGFHPKARLVIVDSLILVHPKAENGLVALQSDPILFVLRQLAQMYHVAVVLLYHFQSEVDKIEHCSTLTQGPINGVFAMERTEILPIAKLIVTGREVYEQEVYISYDVQKGYQLSQEQLVREENRPL